MDLQDASTSPSKNIFPSPPLKVKIQTGDLIFENKKKAKIPRVPAFWDCHGCGAIDPIALLLLFPLLLFLLFLLFLLLVFLFLFFGFLCGGKHERRAAKPVLCMVIAPLRRKSQLFFDSKRNQFFSKKSGHVPSFWSGSRFSGFIWLRE